MNAQTLPLPNPGDWGTVAAAAAHLGVSESTIRRMVASHVLTDRTPGMHRGPFEHRPQTMLWWPDVEEIARARARLARS